MDTEKQFSLDKTKPDGTIYLVGIGGAGMSAISTILLEMGFSVAGSDIKKSPNMRRLRGKGAILKLGHRPENLGDAQVVVKSSAIGDDNPEIQEARRRGIPIISRAEMLACILETRRGIAVAGTHGKTTTSSMIAQLLTGCGADPSYVIGGELNETGGNAVYGSGQYVVAEADESDGSFLCLKPYTALITNIDGDHMDFFGSVEREEEVFFEFLKLLPSEGFAVICGDDPSARKVGGLFSRMGGEVIFYGRGEHNDYRASEIKLEPEGSKFVASLRGKEIEVENRVPGIHNVYNSIGAIALCHRLGFPEEDLASALVGFKGVRRRFEFVGSLGGVTIIDDYAHHPTEVKAVMEIVSMLPRQRVVVIFQPHRYSRTRLLAEEFGAALAGADMVVVTDIYSAGEDAEPGISGELVAESVRRHSPGTKVLYVPDRIRLASEVVSLLREGDVVLTIGAGDITLCGREIIEILERG